LSAHTLAACLALTTAVALAAPAFAAEPKAAPVSLAILYPISTNQDPDVSTTIQLSALYGRVGSVRGLGLNGAVSLFGNDLRGIGVTGLYSQVNGEARGLRLTWGANYTIGDSRGVQIAGLVNVNRGQTKGLQYGGLFNLVGKSMSGLEASSVLNMVDQDGRGIQLSGFGNAIGGSFDGWQVAAGFNYVGNRLVGLQLGGVNTAVQMEGTQIGLTNFSQRSTGLQIGVLNSSDEQKGVPVGMVNLARNGDVDWVTYGSNISGFNTGLRTSIRRFYSMLTAGMPDAQGDVSQTLILTWNYGYAIPAGKRTSVGLDLGFAHYIPEKTDDSTENDRLHFAIQARGLVERSLSRKARGFIGGGVARIASKYRLDAPFETKPMFFGGVALY
jgi:hypothetical protein